jgi:uncharacterized protein YdeI (YjbR/CyaY-like superfamily)
MNMNDINRIELMPDTLEDWTSWLSIHHLHETCIWLRIRKAKSDKPGIFLAQAVIEALRFGWVDGRVNTIDQDFFWLRFTPRGPKSVWSLINRKRVETMIENGTLTEQGYKTVEWGKAFGTWQEAYTSYEKTELPEDLKLALDQDEQAKLNFERWSNSDKLQVIYWIATAKKQETKCQRIQKLITLVRNNGNLTDLSKKIQTKR